MELPQTGGCQCGGVRYEITWLRAPGRGVPPGSRRTEWSPSHDRQWPRVDPLSLPGVRRVVCTAPRPGATVRNVRGGTLDDTSWLRPTAHIWTRSKQRWLPIPEGDRKFEMQPPGDPWWSSVIPAG